MREVLVVIEGISHITFIVNDLEHTSTFLRSIFDAEEGYSSEDKSYSLSKDLSKSFFLLTVYGLQ